MGMTVDLCVCMHIEVGCGCVYVGCKLACVLTPPLPCLTTYQFLSSLVKCTLLPFRRSFWTSWEVPQPWTYPFLNFCYILLFLPLGMYLQGLLNTSSFQAFTFSSEPDWSMDCLLLGFPIASARPWYCGIRTSMVWKPKRDCLSQLVHSTSEIMEHLFHLLRSIS